jgi:hypothetical protein
MQFFLLFSSLLFSSLLFSSLLFSSLLFTSLLFSSLLFSKFFFVCFYLYVFIYNIRCCILQRRERVYKNLSTSAIDNKIQMVNFWCNYWVNVTAACIRNFYNLHANLNSCFHSHARNTSNNNDWYYNCK